MLLTVTLSKYDLEVITQTITSPLNISVALPTIMLLQSKHLRRFLLKEADAHAQSCLAWLSHPRDRILPGVYFCVMKKFGVTGGNRLLPS